MLARKPPMLVRVALANKMARIVWALLARGEVSRDGMPEPADLARPVVRAGAGLHRHRAGWLGREEREDLVPPQLLAEQNRS
jgi:hypothetical protein